MKVFLRTFNPDINSKTGAPMPAGKRRSGAARWSAFEALLQRGLSALGCSLVVQPENPQIPDEPQDSDLRVYAHKTRRDVDGQLFYMQTHLSDLFTLDAEGWGVDHSCVPRLEDYSAGPADDAARFAEGLRESMLRTGASKHDQPAIGSKLGHWLRQRRLPRQWILVPLQIPRDYVAIHHAPLTVLEFIALVEAFAAKARVPFLLKLHPYNTKDRDIHAAVERAIASSPYVLRAEGNIQVLLAAATGVWTINSGVGFEALVHGKPVVTFGDCDYRSAAFAADADRLDAALEYTLADDAARRLRAQQLVHHYCLRHGYQLSDPGAAARVVSYLEEWLRSFSGG